MKPNFIKKIRNFFSEVDRGAYLVTLGMLYATIFFCSFVMGYKTVDLYGRILCSSVLVFPLLFPLNDSITELLGAKVSYFMIFAIILCEFIFSFVTYGLAALPSPARWHNQEIYPTLTSGFIFIACADSVALAVGFISNTYILDNWGTKWFGNGFFRRSLGATAIGELIFTVLTNIITFHILGDANISNTTNIIISDYVLKMIYSLFICIPNAWMVSKIKSMIPNQKIVFQNERVISIAQRRVRYRT